MNRREHCGQPAKDSGAAKNPAQSAIPVRSNTHMCVGAPLLCQNASRACAMVPNKLSHSRAMTHQHACWNASLMSKCKPCLCDGAKKSMCVTGRDARHLLHEAPARNLRETATQRRRVAAQVPGKPGFVRTSQPQKEWEFASAFAVIANALCDPC